MLTVILYFIRPVLRWVSSDKAAILDLKTLDILQNPVFFLNFCGLSVRNRLAHVETPAKDETPCCYSIVGTLWSTTDWHWQKRYGSPRVQKYCNVGNVLTHFFSGVCVHTFFKCELDYFRDYYSTTGCLFRLFHDTGRSLNLRFIFCDHNLLIRGFLSHFLQIFGKSW